MVIHGKKGGETELSWDVLLQAALAIFMVVSVWYFYYEKYGDQSYFLDYYSKDFSLVMDSTLSAPGDLNLTYGFVHDGDPLDLEIRDGLILFYVYEEEFIGERIPKAQPYIADTNINVKSGYFSPLEIEIFKNKTSLNFEVEVSN